MTPSPSTLGSRLRAYRLDRARMTIEQVSKLSGVSIGGISEIETGKHDPQVGTLIKMLKAMGNTTGLFKLY